MINPVEYPMLLFVLSLVALLLSVWIGGKYGRRRGLEKDAREDFGIILASALTILGLLIGFCFSMAVNRYDQRKNYEEAEANAIGTEYLRADLLPASDGEKVRALLQAYLIQRVLAYTASGKEEIRQINVHTAQLQADMWSAVMRPAGSLQTPTIALAVSGMNDVLNSEGYTQAAWWNRIPIQAWLLMGAIAVCCNAMIGFGARNYRTERLLFMIVPVVVSISFFLIADVDSPRTGIIRIEPHNLKRLAESLRTAELENHAPALRSQ